MHACCRCAAAGLCTAGGVGGPKVGTCRDWDWATCDNACAARTLVSSCQSTVGISSYRIDDTITFEALNLSSPTPLLFSGDDDWSTTAITIGFPFMHYGSQYDKVGFSFQSDECHGEYRSTCPLFWRLLSCSCTCLHVAIYTLAGAPAMPLLDTGVGPYERHAIPAEE
jgi:hypothetical protein